MKPILRLPALVLLAAALGASLGACSDLTKPRADFRSVADTLVFRALNANAPAYPNALAIDGPAAVRAASSSGIANFDLAFDIDGAGTPVLRPVGTVIVPCQRARCSVGFRPDSTHAFEELREAPTSGYRMDSAMAIRTGWTYFVRAQVPTCGAYYQLSDVMYAKLVVDSILPDSSFYVRVVSDNNCGFVGLRPDTLPAK